MQKYTPQTSIVLFKTVNVYTFSGTIAILHCLHTIIMAFDVCNMEKLDFNLLCSSPVYDPI